MTETANRLQYDLTAGTPVPAEGILDGSGHSRDPAATLAALRGIGQDGWKRFLTGVLASERQRISGRAAASAETARWDDSTEIGDDGIGFDSLARMELSAVLNQRLGLSQTGVEDYLLVHTRLGDWARLLEEHFIQYPSDRTPLLGFSTSGSTGDPKEISHSAAALLNEVMGIVANAGSVRRVVSLVPCHHIYGFLFGLLLPSALGVAVLDRTRVPPTSVLDKAEPGDLIVATPFHWGMIAADGPAVPPGVQALSSGAPSKPAQWAMARKRGMAAMIEIYGSTETSGVGMRTDCNAPFDLLPHLVRNGDRIGTSGGVVLPLQDRLDWCSTRQFRPKGRLDGAIQIGGVNVIPSSVAGILSENPEVADVVVRPEDTLNGRLKAFVVPQGEDNEPTNLEANLRAAMAARLPAAARPVSYTFGSALPRNDMGKLADWAISQGDG